MTSHPQRSRSAAEIADELQRLISSHFHIDLSAGGTTLLEGGLSFDSVSLIQLIVLLQEHFQISFEEEELRPELFKDLPSLTTLVIGKLGASAREDQLDPI